MGKEEGRRLYKRGDCVHLPNPVNGIHLIFCYILGGWVVGLKSKKANTHLHPLINSITIMLS